MPTGKFACDRCGFARSRSVMRKEWTGFWVCFDTCWDPRPPQLDPPNVYPEGVPFPNARPEPPVVELTDDDPVTWDDL